MMAFTYIAIYFAQAQSRSKHDILVFSAAIQNLYRINIKGEKVINQRMRLYEKTITFISR